MDSSSVGAQGENIAKKFLESEGYAIVSQNFRTKFGEIDLIALKGGYLIFIEVKSRSGELFGSPAEAVTKKKLDKIIKSSNVFISQNEELPQNIRYDAVEVFYDKGEAKINHIENITL